MQGLESESTIPKSQIIAYGKAVSKSVDALVAFDLSTHLFRAFSLKHDRFRRRPPRKSLTAWPLPPKVVTSRGSKGEAWIPRTKTFAPYTLQNVRPTQELQDLLVAEILRLSKASLEQYLSSTRCSLSQSSTIGGKVVQDQEEPINLGVENESEASEASMDPALLADDDEAAQMLRPSTQHFMAKLDALLMRLYFLKKSALRFKASRRKTTQNRWLSSCKDNLSHDGFTKRDSKCLRRKKVPKTPARNRVHENDGSSTGAYGDIYTCDHQRAARRRIGHLTLLTWDDVVVTASMCSFDPDTLLRTQARCSPLLSPPQVVQSFCDKDRSSNASQMKLLDKEHWLHEVPEIDKEEVNEEMHTDDFMRPIKGRKSWKYWKGAVRKRSASSEMR